MCQYFNAFLLIYWTLDTVLDADSLDTLGGIHGHSYAFLAACLWTDLFGDQTVLALMVMPLVVCRSCLTLPSCWCDQSLDHSGFILLIALFCSLSFLHIASPTMILYLTLETCLPRCCECAAFLCAHHLDGSLLSQIPLIFWQLLVCCPFSCVACCKKLHPRLYCVYYFAMGTELVRDGVVIKWVLTANSVAWW